MGSGSGITACDGSKGKCLPNCAGGGTRNSSVAWIISSVDSPSWPLSGTWRQVQAFGM
jgi:hypothetical protein